MFEWSGDAHSTFVRPTAVTTQELHDWLAGLALLDDDVSDAERIDQLRALEELKAAAAAAQARVTADLAESVRAQRAARGFRAPSGPAGSAPRSPWRDGTPRTAADSISASRGRS